MFDQFREIVLQNEFFQGGAIIAALSWAWYKLGALPATIMRFANRYAVLAVTFNYGTRQFDHMANHICGFYEESKSGSFISIPLANHQRLVPSGSRWIRRGLCWINTNLIQRELKQSDHSKTSVTFDLHVTAYGLGKRRRVEALIDEASAGYRSSRRRSLYVKCNNSGWWEEACRLPKRAFETVYTRHKSRLIDDLGDFLGSEKEYMRKGVPFRRGYLLYGPPGTGKTSVATAIANHLRRNLHVIGCSTTGSALRELLSGDNQLILIEDIDSAMKAATTRENTENSPAGLIEFSTADLLNAIDGVTSGHGNILIVTTNYPDRIDTALLRPGRIDVRVEMGTMNEEEWRMICKAYYDVSDPPPLPRSNITVAEAQGHMQACDDFAKFIDSWRRADADHSESSSVPSYDYATDVSQSAELRV